MHEIWKLIEEAIDTTIKDLRNLFRLVKENEEIKDRVLGGLRNLFRIEKENKTIKDIIVRNIRNLFENEEEENYCKPVRLSNFWSNNYIEYRSNGDRNKTLSVEEYLNKTRPYLKDIINNLKKSDTVQLTITINFIYSTDDNDKEGEMYSKSYNIEIMMNNEADEVTNESLKKWYQTKLEELLKGSKIMFIYCIMNVIK